MNHESFESSEEISVHLNALAKAASAYLRSAMHQPVDWQEWGEAAFEKAKAADKPILLDIGAVWCHWCHVMDRESYESAATAKIINDHFIAVKVDRDERPDVDTRYQAAVSAISGQGGWPLTAFLTPEGKPYFGGTYFPPADQHGRPGFQRVLLTMAEAFQNRRDEVNESAGSVMAAIEHNESFMGRSGNPGPELVEKLVASTLKQFDSRSGGFGSQPKFPHSGAIDLLLDVSSRVSTVAGADGEAAKTAAMVTLQKMSRGGIYDHLAGGFHRYSVDERWVVPHFEKMSYDNSELLKNYVHAFQTFVEPEAARVAREMIQWIDEWLSDRERGGFYASQDADFSLEDDGDYFTWTRDEAAAVLTDDEMAVASAYYDIGDIGDMHHNPAKNVLHVRGTLEGVAKANAITLEVAKERLDSAKAKLYAARLKRPTPYVDKTIYVGWNGMMISAYVEAGRVLDMPEVRAFALKSLDRVLAEAWRTKQNAGEGARAALLHVVSYSDPEASRREVPGQLDDYAFTGLACLDAYEATADLSYYKFAHGITDAMIARFYDATSGGFFDSEPVANGKSLGVLATRRKPLQDSPTPAGNPMAAIALARMHHYADDRGYKDKAELTLEAFGGVAEQFGIFAATYGIAVVHLLESPVQVVVITADRDESAADELYAAALAPFAFNKSTLRLSANQVVPENLPPGLASTIPHLPDLNSKKSFAVLCSGSACQPPVTDAAKLQGLLQQALEKS
jgi:uncharacterized protein YyaL (SSP411 family)